MKRFSYLVLLMIFSLPSNATLPEGLQLVGQSTMKVLWFDIYDARLSTESGRYSGFDDEALLLSLKYKRDISVKDLLDETDNQWQHQKVAKKQRELWLSELASIWPDIRKDDELSFYVNQEQQSFFYFNGELLGKIEFNTQQVEFNRAFLNIWLAENSKFPDLSRRLRGDK